MPRRVTAKQKTSPETGVSKRPRRQSMKQDARTTTSSPGEERRSRRSSTAAQTAASVAEATRVTRSSRSQGSNQANSSDRKSTSRETSLEPAEVRSSARVIKKINYQESEGDEEDSQPKKVEKVEEEEEDYNAEDDVENDSDSGDVGRNKVKVRSPPARSRGRPQRKPTPKVETPTKASPRGRRAKAEKKEATPTGENESDFVAPSRRGRYDEDPEEEPAVRRGRMPSRSTRATRQAATPRTAPQRPTRTSRRQKNLVESKEEEEIDDDDDEEESKEDTEIMKEKKELDNKASTANKKAKNEDGSKKRKAADDTETRKRQKMDGGKGDNLKAEDDDKEDDLEPMEVDEVDSPDESEIVPEAQSDKETELKSDLDLSDNEEKKEKEMKKTSGSTGKSEDNDIEEVLPEAKAKVCEPAASGVSDPDPEMGPESAKSSPIKVQVPMETKPATVEGTTSIKDPKAPMQEINKMSPEEEKRKTEPTQEQDKRGGGELAVKNAANASQTPVMPEKTERKYPTENNAKSKEPQTNSVVRPMEGSKCDGSAFNGCKASPEKVIQGPPRLETTAQDQPKAHSPSTNSFYTNPGTTNPQKEPESSVAGSNGIQCNQNFDSRNRKYVVDRSFKEEDRFSCKDRTFGFVSYNMGGNSMQASKALLEFVPQLNGIICLQDINEEFYRSHLKSSFESQGYKVIFSIPSGQKSGLAILYKTALFSLKQHKGISLKEVITKDLEQCFTLLEEERSGVKGLLKNCGHMLIMHLMLNDRPVTVANVSIPPADLNTHTLQTSCVARETLNFLEGTSRPLLICGTFNMQENNAAYQLLRDGYLCNDMIELLQSKKDIPRTGKENASLVDLLWKSFMHSAVALKSCYASVMGSEIKIQGKNITLPDLMWYSSDCLKTLGVLGEVENAEQVSTGHLLLKADLAFSD